MAGALRGHRRNRRSSCAPRRRGRRCAGCGRRVGTGAAGAGRAPVAPPPPAPVAPPVSPPPPAPEPPAPAARAPVAEAAPSDTTLLGGVAAAMALVKAYRMHGHLAARLDPLGSEPMGDPALDETRLQPPLTPELQERIPASLLRLYVPGETLRDALPHLREVYTGTIAYEIEHISTTPSACGCARRSSRGVTGRRSRRRSGLRCYGGCRRSRGWSSTCGGRSSGKSSFRSKASTCSSRCSTSRSSSLRRTAHSRSWSAWRTAGG